MINKLKTLLLMILIATSLFQSYHLAFSNPKPESYNENGYIETEKIGKPLDLKDVIFPNQIIMHFGNNTHAIIYPSTQEYDSILNKISSKKMRSFYKYLSVNLNNTFGELRKSNKGIEFVFRKGVPFNILQNIYNIEIDNRYENEIIDKVYIYYISKMEKAKVYFVSNQSNLIYEALDSDLNENDIDQMVAYTKNENLYEYLRDDILIPINSIQTSIYDLKYTQYNVDQLRRTLFVDPGVTRYIKEQDGSEIFTDGNRGLQIINMKKRFNYTNPIASVSQQDSIKDQLLTSVKFINDHGGWDATYQFVYKSNNQYLSKERFNFEMYFKKFPVLDNNIDKTGTIQIVSQNGVITSYERSLIIWASGSSNNQSYTLVGGKDLKELINKFEKKDYIIDIYPAYRIDKKDEKIILNPTWLVELRNGTTEFLQ